MISFVAILTFTSSAASCRPTGFVGLEAQQSNRQHPIPWQLALFLRITQLSFFTFPELVLRGEDMAEPSVCCFLSIMVLSKHYEHGLTASRVRERVSSIRRSVVFTDNIESPRLGNNPFLTTPPDLVTAIAALWVKHMA